MPTHESPCDMMRRVAKSQREAIRRQRAEIHQVEKTIDTLQQQPEPDLGTISALEQTLQSLNEQLEQNELSLETLEAVISENC
ncbi:hypothetical protein ABZ725_17900 [Streptomyces sp. NPDC006872]|uniref:hypothetical protein n=1 Tax=Streptomyces sp. NPDC006872 TaxID=3155720 RepID=UPI0033D8DCE1